MVARILGSFGTQPGIQLPESYFQDRDCWVDCRQPNTIEIDKTVNLGWEVKFVVQTHNMQPGYYMDVQARPIKIEKNVYIGSFAILYNCIIGENAVVALGSVVRSMIIRPFTMVAGNPAVEIKIYNIANKKWEKI
jgi:acetyltransferase-like isoleucine patch superfamily enzyme